MFKIITLTAFLLQILIHFHGTTADLALGKCPVLSKPEYPDFTCPDIINGLIQDNHPKVLRPLVFLPSSKDYKRINFFAYNLPKNTNDCQMYVHCKAKPSPFETQLGLICNQKQIGVEFYMERKETEDSGYTITNLLYYSQNEKIKNLLKLPDYEYQVRYNPGKWLFIWGCVQVNDTMHDRAFWLLGENPSPKTQVKVNAETAFKEMMDETGLKNVFKKREEMNEIVVRPTVDTKIEKNEKKQKISYFSNEFSQGFYKKN